MTVQIDGLEVVLVLRQCRVCGQWKPLEHYYLYSHASPDKPVGSKKVRAGCRLAGKKAS